MAPGRVGCLLIIVAACGNGMHGAGSDGGVAGSDGGVAGSDGGVAPDAPPAPANIVVVDDSGMALAMASFANTTVGASSEQTVHVTNVGGQPTGAIAVSANGDFAIDDAGTTCAGAVLSANARCDVAIRFSPSAIGSRSGTLAVAAAPGGSAVVLLDGEGVEGNLQLSSTTIDLGDVDVGTSASGSVTITNSGTGPGAIGAPGISGAGWSLGPSTCGASLDAGASCTIGVVFAPTALGEPTASLSVMLDGMPASVTLEATGTSTLTVALSDIGSGTGTVTSNPSGISCGSACSAHFAGAVTLTAIPATGSTFAGWSEPSCTGTTCSLPASTMARSVTATFGPGQLYVAPGNLSIGPVAIGSSSPTMFVQLENDNAAALPIAISLVGTDYAFTDNHCGTSLAANGECMLQLEFTPTALGERPGDLQVVVNGMTYGTHFDGIGARFVTIAVVGDPASSVTSDAMPLSTCSGVCSAMLGQNVTFTAVPAAGATFDHWSDPSCTGTRCTMVATTGPQTLRAYFHSSATVPALHFELGPSPGYVWIKNVTANAHQTFTIVNDTTSAVSLDEIETVGGAWSVNLGTCGASLPALSACTVTGAFQPSSIGDGPGDLLEVFSGPNMYTATLDACGAGISEVYVEGHGYVTGNYGLDCPGFCNETHPGDTFTAQPGPGWSVEQWGVTPDGPCSGSTCELQAQPGGDSLDVVFTTP